MSLCICICISVSVSVSVSDSVIVCVCIRRGPVSPEEGIVLPCPEPKPVDGRENCCQLLQAGGDEGVVEDTQSRGGRDGPWVGEVVYGVGRM